MSLASHLVHTIVIERATDGPPDDDNQPSRTYNPIATVQALIAPKSIAELVQANQAGAVVGTYTIHLYRTDVTEADYVLDAEGRIFEILGKHDFAFGEAHLELDAQLVSPSAA